MALLVARRTRFPRAPIREREQGRGRKPTFNFEERPPPRFGVRADLPCAGWLPSVQLGLISSSFRWLQGHSQTPPTSSRSRSTRRSSYHPVEEETPRAFLSECPSSGGEYLNPLGSCKDGGADGRKGRNAERSVAVDTAGCPRRSWSGVGLDAQTVQVGSASPVARNLAAEQGPETPVEFSEGSLSRLRSWPFSLSRVRTRLTLSLLLAA